VDAVIVTVGTSDDADANRRAVVEVAAQLAPELRPDQLVVVRSTVPAGTTAAVEVVLRRAGLGNEVAYCPERAAEGAGFDEIGRLPQLIGARTASGQERARRLFAPLGGPPGGVGEPEEVELAKLFANAYRYAHFAISNELYMVADRRELDFVRIRSMVVDDYERAATMPRAGFAGGPCLRKDASMVAEDTSDGPSMTAAAVRVNDHLPAHVVDKLAAEHDLGALRVGVLGLAFKGGSDDTRGSLALDLCELLRARCRELVVSDPYVDPEEGVSTDVLVGTCDLVVIGAPHPEYEGLVIGRPVVDPWGLTRREEAV
jgi:UDP-N-acetyl-D-mannosaminuronic acid dehydrogenase